MLKDGWLVISISRKPEVSLCHLDIRLHGPMGLRLDISHSKIRTSFLAIQIDPASYESKSFIERVREALIKTLKELQISSSNP
jgi:hypothetical protein